MHYHHIPVFHTKAIELLRLQPSFTYIDCTLGGSGHFGSMIDTLQAGTCIGFDVDTDAIETARLKLLQKGFQEIKNDDNVWLFALNSLQAVIIHDNFVHLEARIKQLQTWMSVSPVKGILLDLGVSSHQLDIPEKGFSYMKDGPLDMRMDQTLQVQAMDLINGLYEKELVKIFQEFGEELFAKRIAKAIIKSRQKKSITTTGELTKIIKQATPAFYKNPYAKVFQALRIAVNDELGVLHRVCSQISVILESEGRIVSLSFHSLEDKVIKDFFAIDPMFDQVQEVLVPSNDEINENKRARSAKLRCYQKK